MVEPYARQTNECAAEVAMTVQSAAGTLGSVLSIESCLKDDAARAEFSCCVASDAKPTREMR